MPSPKLIKDINPGEGGSFANEFTSVGNTLYFKAFNGVDGTELWKSDGTEEGTQLVKDIRPGSDNSDIKEMSVVADALYFSADNGVNGDELWVSDGTEQGTQLLFDIRPGRFNSSPEEITALGDTIFFTAFDVEAVSQLKSLGQNIVKTASMDLNNIQLHRCIAKHKFETVIISTGMSDINEIHRTLSLYPKDTELLIMSCRSAYPTSFYDVDFGEIQYLRQETERPVGFSDHTQDLYASMASTLCGASFIERHFTTNQSLVGPDNAISLNSNQIKILTKMLDSIHKTLQYKRKIIHPVEQQTFAIQKKSLRFPYDMQRGERIHTDNLIAIAPPEGFSRFHIDLTPGFYTIEQNVRKMRDLI